ncbi:unnamed protein product [Rhodiola kirilowii]
MDESEQNVWYPQRRLPTTNRHQSAYGGQTSRALVPVRNPTHSRPVNFNKFQESYVEDEVDEEDEDGYDEDEMTYGGMHNRSRGEFSRGGVEEDEYVNGNLKKRKMKSVMDYELVGGRDREFGARNGSREWSEHETFLLLEAWGDRYLELGRKSLRSEDWKELAEKVSEASDIDRSDVECRNKMDTLKKRYRKEKVKMEQFGGQCRWACFKKLDMLLTTSPRQQCGLACGVDSGEYVFMNPRVYLNCANGLDEMRDSPGNSEDDGDDSEGDDEDGGIEGSASFRCLADSIKRFGEIYEKIESSKRQQMMELEKMRMDFQKEMELQKKQILDMAEAEIEKLRENDEDEDDDDGGGENVDDGDTDVSAENLSR